MDNVLVLILLASAVLAAWTYSRAWRVHNVIERSWPGTNERMRRTCGMLKRWGLKK